MGFRRKSASGCSGADDQVTRGPAGYGRYDSDPEHVGCPYARTSETPCVARDGRLALDGDQVCAGCDHPPVFLIEDLAIEWPAALDLLPDDDEEYVGDPDVLADEFAITVREATAPRREAP